MKKYQTVLDKLGQDGAARMSKEERAAAKVWWESRIQLGVGVRGGPGFLGQVSQSAASGLVELRPGIGKTAYWLDGGIYYLLMSKASKPPGSAQFLLFMLSPQRREDVFSDLSDWYPTWCENFGTRRAKFLCWWRVSCCVGSAVLEVAGQIAEVCGKFAGLK